MKPRKITMQAFGPYLKKTTIDFTPLYDHGLFLITGATGCGKTTILDAMSYALYGHASGSLRDVRDMRSIAAPDSLDTSVEFETELGGTLYRFERAMKIRVVKKRTGETERRVDYEENCYRFDGEKWRLLCTGTQVKNKAVELLGFSHEQFSQVVVLPQGEFRRLLTAPSSDKQKILEKLFGTARWQAFTNALAQKSKALEAELSQCKERTAALCKSVECENLEALDALIEKTGKDYDAVKAAVIKLEAASKTAAAALNDAAAVEDKFKQLDAAREKIEKLQGKTKEIETKRRRLETAEKASKVEAYLSALEQAQKTLKAAEQNLEAANTAYAAAQKEDEAASKALEKIADAEAKLKELAAKTARFEGVLEPARQLSKESEALEEKKKVKNTAKADIEKLSENIEKLSKKSEELKARIKEIDEKYVSRLPDLAERKAELTTRVGNFDELEKRKNSAEELKKKLLQKRAEYKKIEQSLENEKAALEKMQKAFDADAAYRLSSELHDGEKCPVCGSTVHPEPAKATEGAPTKEQIDRQKSIVDDLEKKKKDALEEGLRVKGDYSAAAKLLSEMESVCEKYDCAADEARAKLSEVKKAYDEAVNAQKLLEPLKEQQSENDSALEKAKEEHDRLKEEWDKINLEISALEGRLEQLRSAVPEDMRNVDAVNTQIANLNKDYENTETQIKQARTRADAASKALAVAMEKLSLAKNARLEAENGCKSAKEKFESRLEAEGLPSDADIRSLLLTDKERDDLKTEIESFKQEMAVQKDRVTTLENRLEGVRRPDIKALQEAEAEAREKWKQAVSQKGSLEENIKNLKSVKAELVETAARKEKLDKDYALYYDLYRRSSGVNPLKTPIQQFVLGIMLDDIVASANIHLSRLSRGRYTLVRTTEVSRGNGAKGLDLAVSDSWSGGERSVNTLSGGEMFLASLSLAFGLSDVVQSYAGGIRLDSLFIDEGFGSLDSETLDTAMNALESLRLSGRLIGVISHVGELSERIPAHIQVKRLADGSSGAAVETP